MIRLQTIPFRLVKSSILFYVLTCLPVTAQIVPDGTLPINSAIQTQGSSSIITGGTKAGSNLFHSFEQFSVLTGREAYFDNALDIQNIISRVTGESISNIDGLIRANGTANLFLFNPNGIAFGSNARLNIGGSFVGSTASSLNFADGTQFSATAPQTTPLLTVSVPIGLQFGSNAGSIQVQGNGQGTRTTTELIDTTVGLRVQPNQTLALLGGDVALQGGTLKTAGGRIELGGVAGPGLVSLTPIDSGWALGYEGVPTFGDIQLSGQATVDASGEGGGDIQVRGRQVTLLDGSQIEASTLGAEPGGTLNVNAKESVELSGTSANSQVASGLFTSVYPGATGAGGSLTLETGRLSIRYGAQIRANTFSEGSAGTLVVNAKESVELSGTSADGQFPSSLSTSVQGGTGAGGNLTLETRRLSVTDGAQISAVTFGKGSAGSLAVNAKELVELSGTSADGQFPSSLSTSVQGGTGAGGNLTIETGRLSVRDGAHIGAVTFGEGSAGSLAVNAKESVELSGTSADGQLSSGLFTSSQPGATGAGGSLTLKTGRLSVRDGAQISAVTFGSGSAGSLAVNAKELVELSGTSADGQFFSNLSTSVQGGSGAGGNLTIETGRLSVRDGAQIGAATFGSGSAGSLAVNAKESVELSGTSVDGRSRSALTTTVQRGGTGAGGNLTIETGRLSVRDGAQIGAATFGSGSAGTLAVNAKESVELSGTSADGHRPSTLSARTRGAGNAGDLRIETGQLTVRDKAEVTVSSEGSGRAGQIEVQAGSIHLDNQGKLNAATTSTKGGDITLQVQDLLLMRNNSSISATAGTAGAGGDGGNITIDTGTLTALENSDITANAFEGRGGNIQINTQGLFRSPDSDITASSQLGINGTVEINTPDVDPSRGLVTLPTELVDASNQIAQSCPGGVGPQASKFVSTGRGGIPENPNEMLNNETVWTDSRLIPLPAESRPSSPADSTQSTNPTEIVEANGWVVNSKGEVILTATAPSATIQVPWIHPSGCHAS